MEKQFAIHSKFITYQEAFATICGGGRMREASALAFAQGAAMTLCISAFPDPVLAELGRKAHLNGNVR